MRAVSSAVSAEQTPPSTCRPRSFFQPPYPDNLITVPSCSQCNHGSHLDDDYVLGYLVSLDMPGASPTLELVRDRVKRGLHRPGFPGLRRRLQTSVVFNYDRDPATGTRVASVGIRSEPARLTRWLKKQVRGLAYHITGKTLWRSTFVQLERTHFRHTRPPEFWEMWIKASDYVLKGETGSVGDVFRYAYRQIKRSACASVVRLEYYGVFSWVALVYRPEFAPTAAGGFPILTHRGPVASIFRRFRPRGRKMDIDTLKRAALRRPPEERARLGSELLESLDELWPENGDRLWLEEAARRAAQIDSREVELISAEEVDRKARALLR